MAAKFKLWEKLGIYYFQSFCFRVCANFWERSETGSGPSISEISWKKHQIQTIVERCKTRDVRIVLKHVKQGLSTFFFVKLGGKSRAAPTGGKIFPQEGSPKYPNSGRHIMWATYHQPVHTTYNGGFCKREFMNHKVVDAVFCVAAQIVIIGF